MFNALFTHLTSFFNVSPYKSFGLVGSYIVEEHVKCTGEKSTLPW